jgi:AcrR family transcriptional regulator
MPPAEQSTDERDRLRAAFVDVVAERGYRATHVQTLLDRTGLDYAAFRRHYASLEAVFAELWEEAEEELVERTSTAFFSGSSWREGMRAAAWKLCRWTQSNPRRARLMFVELAFAGEALRARRDQTFTAYAALIHRGREERPEAADVLFARAEATMGAIWNRLASSVRAGEFDALPYQVPQMMFMTVMPYLGAEAAREELRRGPKDIDRYERGEI